MAKKIKLELTEIQFNALVDIVESAQTVFEEIPEETRNISAIKRMFNKNGYESVLANLNN